MSEAARDVTWEMPCYWCEGLFGHFDFCERRRRPNRRLPIMRLGAWRVPDEDGVCRAAEVRHRVDDDRTSRARP